MKPVAYKPKLEPGASVRVFDSHRGTMEVAETVRVLEVQPCDFALLRDLNTIHGEYDVRVELTTHEAGTMVHLLTERSDINLRNTRWASSVHLLEQESG